tara:strand:- start:169 stop:522 length:354 start_codon:yes stop_codon:yes gene_type:complete
VTDLVLGLPFSEADHEHAEDFVFGPEAVLLPWLEEEFVMSLRVKDLIVDLEYRSVVEKVKELMPDGMGVKACPLSRFDFGKIDAAVLVAHHHVDVAPWSLGMNGLLSMSGIGHDDKF